MEYNKIQMQQHTILRKQNAVRQNTNTTAYYFKRIKNWVQQQHTILIEWKMEYNKIQM